jgi:hypothetical protein
VKLPHANEAIVEREKITGYLLDAAHPDNGGKARFFKQFGFKIEQWEILAKALKTLAIESEAATVHESPHGKKYVIIGRIQSPRGKTPTVKTIWVVDKNQNAARLVTAYPHKVRPDD